MSKLTFLFSKMDKGVTIYFKDNCSASTLFSGMKYVKCRLNLDQNFKKTRPNLDPI